MNNILQLKRAFQQRSNDNKPGPRNVPKNSSPITIKKLQSLLNDLQNVGSFWKRQNIIQGCLIDVNYVDVIAKSNRISGFFYSGKESVNNTVVGARFANEKSPKHVITHYVSSELLGNTIENLKSCIHLISEEFGDSITYEAIDNLKENDIDYSRYNIAKTTFRI